MKIKYLIPVLITITVLMISCKKDKPIVNEPVKTGKISFQFLHKVNGSPLLYDTMLYTNTAGNLYKIDNIQYFISEVTLNNSNGSIVNISAGNGIHYLDTGIPSSQTWLVDQDIPVGNYTSVNFIFGINETKNKFGLFTNPPEVDMFWPEFLGGGYHYMKMNGAWKDTNNQITPFGLHLGIGQIYAHNVINIDSITGFVQNYFTVNLPNSSFAIAENATTHAEIIMNVNSWFDTPNVWDFNYWGGSIMQNQVALHTIVENGADVFSFQFIQ